MIEMNNQENDEFTRLLKSAIGEAEKLKYRPTQFKKMVDAYGGLETVNRVLATGKPSDGFTRLWELGHLELTCEAIIVETKWRNYFEADVVARAEKLLREMGYPFKRFEGDAANGNPSEVAGLETTASREVHPSHDDFPSVPMSASGMRINAYFRDLLNAPVANARWSWGSVDERTRRVFLRLWRMDIDNLEEHRIIRVLGHRRTDRPGWNERARHLELIRKGYLAFAVVCDKDAPESGVIRGFDHDSLLRLGRVIDRDGMVYMEVVESIPVEAIARPRDMPGTLEPDLREIQGAELNVTTRSALVDARLGQGRFRRELLRRWGGACAVTGCRVGAVLRSSHCKPWRDSDNRERLDSHNGLVLTATLDALFDAGLISFEDSGEMLVSAALLLEERAALGLPAKLLRRPGARLSGYLLHHRSHCFQA